MHRSPVLSLTFSAVFFLMAGAASAQGTKSGLVLEEIIVTATKREQSLQDVAVAVTALSDQALRQAQITSSAELTFLVPSLTLQKGNDARESSFNIRGIGTQSFSIGTEPSVSTMLDGVVMGRSGQAFMELMDIERVEVLRGPQGTLFGKNSTGGVVHIITQKPTEEHSGEVMAAVLNDQEYRAGFTLSGPITDELGYRLTASGTDIDGYTRNYFDGKDYNGSQRWTARGKLRWSPSDDLDIMFASDYNDSECDCSVSAIRSIEPWAGNEAEVQEILDRLDPVVPGKNNSESNIDLIPSTESSQWGNSLTVDWSVGDYTLTSITAARGFDIDGNSSDDYDGQPVVVIGLGQTSDVSQDQVTQELRITSPEDGPITYVAGLYYFEQEIDREFTRFLALGLGDNDPTGTATFSAETTNWAAFGEAVWSISDTWRLIFGGRYTEDEVSYKFRRTQGGLPVGIPAAVAPSEDDTDESDFSGKLALQWDFNDEGMAYLSYTEGYKGPAFDLTFDADPTTQERIDPETSDSWELGVKSTLFDGRATLNAALFHSEYDNFQAEGFFDSDGLPNCPPEDPICDPDDDPGAFLLINAGSVTTEGLELDFQAQVTEQLRVSGGVAWVNAEIDEYLNGPCNNGQTFRGQCDISQDLSGGDLPYSPDWKANLIVAYTWEREGAFDMVFTGMARGQDDILYSLSQDDGTIADSYWIFDASVLFRGKPGGWEASVFVKNLTDEFYPDFIYAMNGNFIPNAYQQTFSKVSQRTYGLETRFSW